MKCNECNQEIDPQAGAIHWCPAPTADPLPWFVIVALCFLIAGMLVALAVGLGPQS